MSIHITVVDPANTPRDELLLVIGLLEKFTAPRSYAPAPLPPAATVVTLDPLDSPDVGVDVQSPQQAFGTPGAAAAFGDAGNVPGAGNPVIIDPATVFLPPAAPSAPSAAPAPVITGVETDNTGLPHDVRIHASTKTKKADGSWTARRGVDPAIVAEVTAQLRQLMAAPGNVQQPPASAPIDFAALVPPTGAQPTPQAPALVTPPAPPAPALITAPPAAATILTAPTGAPTPQAPPAPPAPPAAGAPSIDFPSTAKLVAELVGANRLAQDTLSAICTRHGVPSFGLLFNRPDLVPLVHADILAAVGA